MKYCTRFKGNRSSRNLIKIQIVSDCHTYPQGSQSHTLFGYAQHISVHRGVTWFEVLNKAFYLESQNEEYTRSSEHTHVEGIRHVVNVLTYTFMYIEPFTTHASQV